MNIAVCGENAADREAVCVFIREYCDKNCFEIDILIFDSGEALLSAFLKEAFPVIFLDICLMGMSGVETARKIRESDLDCVIVFITVSAGYALNGYNVLADSYIVKPIEAKKMEKAFAMCRRVLAENSRFIEVTANYQSIRIPVNRIQYVEVYGKAAVLHVGTKVIKTYTPLDKIEKTLGGPPFLRCHRCLLVSMKYVEDMRDRDFFMRNGDIVPIRKNGRAEVKLALINHMCLG